MPSEHPSQSYRLGYVRVSTDDQNHRLQMDAMKDHGIDRVYADTCSGKHASRPALDRLLDELRPGDTVVVWRLDRLGRSTRHLIEIAELFQKTGVGLVSLTEQIDTTSPTGRLTFTIFAALAAFERELLIERTQAGLAAARARGRVGGRPTVWTAEKRTTALAMQTSGEHSIASIARVLGVSRASVYRALEHEQCRTA
jgi:DNA invertase Pin-like site-specific DNA recombinase